ncbi:MAG: DNA-directed RNA polymerase subunit beta [Candidatus Aureabacteria bacterium]|nr:DNA-directed RNA polymerase subunit beta [Candidatus Auribacterota bacterium]
MKKKFKQRIDFGKHKETVDFPNLIDVQRYSYSEFLQEDVVPEKRKNIGLQEVFNEIFPIVSYDGNNSLEFVKYSLGVPKYDIVECKRRGLTYSVALRVTLRLREGSGIKEETVYLGQLPLMTPTGTFIINGAERVVVSQLHRSPGICFEKNMHLSGAMLYSFRVIPYRGSWLEVVSDQNDLLWIYVDRKRRSRKILATTFIRAIAEYETNADIIKNFFDVRDIEIHGKKNKEACVGKVLAEEVVSNKEENKVIKAGTILDEEMVETIENAGFKKVKIVEDEKGQPAVEASIIKMLAKDPTSSKEEALKEIYKKLRPGDPPTLSNAKSLLNRMFFDVKKYDLGRVGRYKINTKLGVDSPEKVDSTALTPDDILIPIEKLIKLKSLRGQVDDIDHLGNRRVRCVGELVQNQCRIGLARMERLIKEKMNLHDVMSEVLTPHKLVNPKGFSTVIKDFFGRSQLSQFMDQTNPLAELTHKRRISALGPGGLSRERAGFEVRDVHTSHYGRICPIETPEGPNIGLIASLSVFTRINEFGFIQTPYHVVEKGVVTKKIRYLTADEEETKIIGQADVLQDEHGKIIESEVSVRARGEFGKAKPTDVEFIDVSPKQLVSVAASLIPFLEHDDANRALMGSNMQRQAVPLMITDSPYVATGMEGRAAVDSGAALLSPEEGVVTYVDNTKIKINDREIILHKMLRSNAGTNIDQRPIVMEGQKIKKGQVIADGPATDQGELAMGKNILVGFLPWHGFNFEDAILVSEELVKEEVFTSIHIDEYEISARDTKLGHEEITRDIPNVKEEALKDLGEDGIIRIGAFVKAGDILVGKITPKSETELSPEERLLRAIFGEKAADVRDASLVVPSGVEGVVMDVRVFSRKDMAKNEAEKKQESAKIRKINAEFTEKMKSIKEDRTRKVERLLLGGTMDVDIVDSVTGKVLIPKGRKITRPMLQTLEEMDYKNLQMEDSELSKELQEILLQQERQVEHLEIRQARDIEMVKRGDELEPGVIKQVKVYVASKYTLQVGDKMAGRHGNKGVIAKILPVEDMPFLPDGTPLQMVLNPLGVPSRMNVGQVLETHLGWAASMLGMKLSTPVFSSISEDEIWQLLDKAELPIEGKTDLYDGRSGEKFDQKVVVGKMYMMKLSHLVADKIHARAVGPYSLVTQQPLGGKAQFGGQRFGEMEVWALEAYGAAYALQELLTVKSDDVVGRTKMYESIIKGDNTLQAGTPESFNVLMREIQSLGLNISVANDE